MAPRSVSPATATPTTDPSTGRASTSLVGFSTPSSTVAAIRTRTDTGTAVLDRASTISALAAVPTDGMGHDVDVAGHGEYRVAAQQVPDGTVIVGRPASSVDGPVSRLVLWEVLVGALGIAAAAGAATLLVRRQLRPLRAGRGDGPHRRRVCRSPRARSRSRSGCPSTSPTGAPRSVRSGSALNTLLVHVESSLAERHRSEQQVRQFVADASHELRTPLTTIAGYTELARRRPDDAETVRTALGKVEEESGRMTALVEDLLLLARLDAGRPLERRPVDLSRLLIEAVSDARVVAPDHRWKLDLPEESVEIVGDGQRLHQVVTNLLTNARKYTPPGTTVTVAATAHAFSVHDDGPGFAPGLAEKAFERFSRGDVARNRGAEGGAGLGLSLVDAVVTAHGGSVTLESHPGSTTLTVSLPG